MENRIKRKEEEGRLDNSYYDVDDDDGNDDDYDDDALKIIAKGVSY